MAPSFKIAEEDDAEVDERSIKPASGIAGFARKAAAPAIVVADDEPLAADETGALQPAATLAGLARSVAPPKIKIALEAEDENETHLKPAADAAGAARMVAKPALKVAGESPSHEALRIEVRAIFRTEGAGYLDELAVALGHLRAADSDAQWEIARRLCHSLKGSAATVGLPEVSAQAQTAEFIARGKPRAGTVTVSAAQSANQVVLTIRDKGRGIDPARVLARAKERGLIATDFVELSNEQTLHTIFTPGFSTASEVSSIAGRGSASTW